MRAETKEFAEFYKAYFEDVFKLVYHRIPNRAVAEDITQDTFLAAWNGREAFLCHPEPKLWLLRTAHYKMLELYRNMKRRATEPLEEEAPELAGTENRYGEIELELSALAAISEEEWRIIKSHYLFGRTIAEIAEKERVSETNMRVRMFRFRKKLRDRIRR